MNSRSLGSGLGLLLGIVLGAASLAGELELPPLFGNHMVLQREQPILIWGVAPPNATVSVSIGAARTAVESDDAGAWAATLPPMDAGGPHTVEVTSDDDSISIKNVLVGDVWICSGQSNMFWRLEQTDRGAEFVEAAGDEPELRLLQIKKVWSRTPEDTVESIGWRMSSPETARRFSAVGYHFGRLLNERTGVPIGLIQSAWGGTPAEAWTPIDTLRAAPDFYADRLASLEGYDLDEETAAARIAEAQAKHETFVELAWREDQGEAKGWATIGHDDASWPTVDLPGYVDGELGGFNGIVWLRRTFHLNDAGDSAELLLGRIDDFDTVYINGQRVGKTNVDQGDGRTIVRRYPVPDGLLRAGTNLIAIALMDVRSSGGVTPDGRPFELRTSSGGIDLSGAWKYRVGFDSRDFGGFPLPGDYAVPVGRVFRRPAALYNAMVHPLTRHGIKGVIWYQGESNAGRAEEYRRLFPEMIEAWRGAWRDARGDEAYGFPFYFVQLPNFRAAVDEPGESSWAELREAQRLADRLPETPGWRSRSIWATPATSTRPTSSRSGSDSRGSPSPTTTASTTAPQPAPTPCRSAATGGGCVSRSSTRTGCTRRPDPCGGLRSRARMACSTGRRHS
jgi:sialate O-acetylesterase